MIKNHPIALILLTYKNKMLLMHKQNSVIDQVKHPWSFIGAKKERKETFPQALARTVAKETGMKVENIVHVSEYYYHANLTDENVNRMQRSEHQLLDFFTLKDLNKLLLTDTTRDFITNHSNLI